MEIKLEINKREEKWELSPGPLALVALTPAFLPTVLCHLFEIK